MSAESAISIRLQLTTRSVPPVPPFDLDTGESPAFWRGENVDFRIGIFNRQGLSVDLSNLAFLQVDIFPNLIPGPQPDTNQGYAPYSIQPYPTTPPAPLLSVTIPAVDITPTITKGGWQEGFEENAVAQFSWADTLSLQLAGQPKQLFSISIHGMTAGGNKLTYGGGPVYVFETGEQGIYLPNDIAPVDVPAYTTLYVQPNQQLLFSETITVEGLIRIEGLLVQV
jgi:hypothetical protein